jgi:drug/metabolite transporter (DMT)-like permease
MIASPAFLGMLLSACAYACFTAADTVTKYLAADYSIFQIMAVQYLFAALLLFVWPLIGKGREALKLFRMRRPRLYAERIFLHMLAQSLVFLALPHMPMSEFYIILFTMPIFVAVISPWLLKEKSSPALWLVILLSFIGTFIALRPEGLTFWAGLAFLGAAAFSYTLIVLRRMAETETAEMTGFMICLGLGGLSVVPMLFYYTPMTVGGFLYMLLAGLFFTLAQITLTAAFRMAPAGLAAVPQFLQLVYGVMAGYLVFGHKPDMYVYIGGAVVIGANLWLIYLQNKKSAKKISF